MDNIDEEIRILNEYNDRDANMPWDNWKTNIYHPRHPIGSLFHEHNHNFLIESLNKLGVDLANKKILDVGCGYGYWLRYFVEVGASPENCNGVDLSKHRIDVARRKNPAINWYHHNISSLPFPDEEFDIVLQSVVFSSIQDDQLRYSCASEMERVIRADGILIWVDLRRTKASSLVSFTEKDVVNYFPGTQVVFHKKVHPTYFRSLHGKFAWLSKLIYRFSEFGCESSLLILRREGNG